VTKQPFSIARNPSALLHTLIMKLFLFLLTLLPLGLLASQPNVVFILVDDLGARDLTNEGSTFYETPNIDRIAKEGMKFSRGYATCQVCSPSRASILTGKYPTNHGITQYIGGASGEAHRKKGRHDSHLPPEYERNLRASEITLAEAMRDAGYKTFFAGKWHLGSKGSWPTDHGFDINKGGFDAGGPPGGFFAPYKNPNLKSGPNGESLTIRLGQETADFIESQKDSKQPFLTYLSYYTVHAPIQTTEALYKKYRDKAKKMGLDKADKRYLFDRRLNVRQVQDNPIYAGMMEQLDQSVGLVLAKLDELGIADNTIVCFTSDNGGVSSGDAYATSNLPLRGGKGRQWEGGIREPYYIKAPGVAEAGSTTDVLASGIDWYPTLLDLCGIAIPKKQKVDGISLVSTLRQKSSPARPLFWHYPHYGNQGGEPCSIIMEGDWKLIHYLETGHDELYDLGKDIGEQNDLLAKHPKLAKEMRNRLDQWLKQTKAKFPVPDKQFDSAKRDARWQHMKTGMKAGLENRAANYFKINHIPSKDWWGSSKK
jgi:arylsulfatase A-like enzyme